MDNDKLISVLEDVRDSQRQLLEEYRRVANESLVLQRQAYETQLRAVAQQTVAVDNQTRHLRLYRRVLVVTVVVISLIIWFLVKNI